MHKDKNTDYNHINKQQMLELNQSFIISLYVTG